MRVIILRFVDFTKVYQANAENRRAVHNLKKAADQLGLYLETEETEVKICDAPSASPNAAAVAKSSTAADTRSNPD